jgi:PTH1 family peptidyl-tRNA hydrolase
MAPVLCRWDIFMRLFVGLGNPGADYAGHRHNIGFMAVDAIAGKHGFGPWRAKFHGEIAEGEISGVKVLLLKPLTYMNESGRAVQAAATFYKVEPAAILVFHDELDLPPGKVRIKTGGGHAGHNGLRSISAHLGEGYGRVRLGIGHPGARERVTGWVLGNFAKADAEWLDALLDSLAATAPKLVAGDETGAMSDIALLTRPARTPEPPLPPGAGDTPAIRPARPNEVPVNAMADTLRRLLAAKPPGTRKGPR